MDKKQKGSSPKTVNISEYRRVSSEPPRQNKRTAKDVEAKVRYQQQQKQKRLAMQRRRAVIVLVLSVIIVAVLMFMTPIFNIRKIAVSGNEIVTLEEINEKVGDLIGENLFKTGESDLTKRLQSIPYIDEVSVSKSFFPPSIKLAVTESKPAAYIGIDASAAVIDSRLKILGDSSIFPDGSIPNIIGIEGTSGEAGGFLACENEEKAEILKTCLETMEKTGVIDKVHDIDISEITSIKFKYDDRFEVLCGTQLDLERKLRLFKETVSNNNLAEKATGTIDLSVTGKAVYTQ